MIKNRPRSSKEEFARRGDEASERVVRPQLTPDDIGKFVVVDIESGAYEIDHDDMAATDRLLARYPMAQSWLVRVGPRTAHRWGGRSSQ